MERPENKLKPYFKVEPVMDLKKQTTAGSEDGARVSALVGDVRKLKMRQYEEVKTVYEALHRGLKVSNNGECLGWRNENEDGKSWGPYRWTNYADVLRRCDYVARGFLLMGLAPGQETFVGLYAQNRPEWTVTEHACYIYNMVVVPLYDTLGPDVCAYIINQAEIRLVVVDKPMRAEALLAKKAQCPSLTTIVLIELATGDLGARAAAAGVNLVQFGQMERDGSQVMETSPAPTPPASTDLCTISYTSGTTGPPKGAMLTHGNVVADCTGLTIFKYATVTSADTMVSFLPLAHMFERVMETAMYICGGRVGFYHGDIKLLTDDLQALKPTVMPVVPRLLNRVYDKVMQEARQSAVKRWFVRKAVESKSKQLEEQIVRSNSMWDQLVFKKVRHGMGGRLRLMVTGSAPVSGETLTFIRCALGCIVVEGYGQTECVAAATLTIEGDHTPEHVGPPIPCCQIKLVDVPDMNYHAKNGVGEVCVKGANVFRGYYREPEKTAEALDADGWLHTGDIGRWTESGTLKLVDRKKNIFKLSQGEYVAPEKLENVFIRSRFVGQVYVHGESLKSCLVAVVSPDPDVLVQASERELGIKGTMAELCKNEKVKKAILDDLTSEGKKAGLQSFELVKDIFLYDEPFTIEAGLLTPTLKSKRQAIKEKFAEQIADMYKKMG